MEIGVYKTDLNSVATQIRAYNKIKHYDMKIQTKYMQYLNLCGEAEDQLNAKNHRWAPKRAFPAFKNFAILKERVQERLGAFCTAQLKISYYIS